MMTLNEALSPLGDGFRKLYGTNDKYSIKDMTTLLSGVDLHNFLPDNSFEATFEDKWISQALNGPSVEEWNKYLAGKVVTISCDAEWSGYDPSKAREGDRFFFESATTDTNGKNRWVGLYFTPTTSNGKQHLTTTTRLPDTSIKSISTTFWDELNPGSYLKVTNIKMTVNPLGGVNSEVLLNTTPDREYSGKAYDFYSASNLPVHPGDSYELSFLGKNDQTAMQYNQNVFIVLFVEDWSWGSGFINAPSSTDYHKATATINVPSSASGEFWLTAYLSHGDNGSAGTDKQRGTGYVKDIMLRKVF
ncbi:MAG TPA: hypothetical protein H9721_02130 [Candidatus Limosilactobacillus intestinipullorum]|nr:hypothetical protein [Candidatus Limosilactobacillus intestinipullorum]